MVVVARFILAENRPWDRQIRCRRRGGFNTILLPFAVFAGNRSLAR
jgi:hypothetical protein